MSFTCHSCVAGRDLESPEQPSWRIPTGRESRWSTSRTDGLSPAFALILPLAACA